MYLLSRMGRETNSEQSRVDRAIHGSGQGFVAALKRKPLELGRHKIGAKIAAPDDYARRSRVAEGRVIGIGVGEGAESAPGHLDLLPFSFRSNIRDQP